MNLLSTMRTIWLPLLLLPAAGLLPVPARAQQAATPPPEMAEMARAFYQRTRELSAQYEESIKTLPQQYQRDIQVLHDHFRKQGNLDGVLATDKEMKRFAAALTAEHDPFELTPKS